MPDPVLPPFPLPSPPQAVIPGISWAAIREILNWLVTSGVGALALAALMGKGTAPIPTAQPPASIVPGSPAAQPDLNALLLKMLIEKVQQQTPEPAEAPKTSSTTTTDAIQASTASVELLPPSDVPVTMPGNEQPKKHWQDLPASTTNVPLFPKPPSVPNPLRHEPSAKVEPPKERVALASVTEQKPQEVKPAVTAPKVTQKATVAVTNGPHWTHPRTIADHLRIEHGVSTSGMTQEQMLSYHDALHEGRAVTAKAKVTIPKVAQPAYARTK